MGLKANETKTMTLQHKQLQQQCIRAISFCDSFNFTYDQNQRVVVCGNGTRISLGVSSLIRSHSTCLARSKDPKSQEEAAANVKLCKSNATLLSQSVSPKSFTVQT